MTVHAIKRFTCDVCKRETGDYNDDDGRAFINAYQEDWRSVGDETIGPRCWRDFQEWRNK